MERQTLVQIRSWTGENYPSRSSFSKSSSSSFELCGQLGVAHDIFLEKSSGQRICRNCGLVVESGIIVPELSGTYQEFSNIPRTLRKNVAISPDLRRALRRPTLISWSETKERQGMIEITRFSAHFDACSSVLKRAQNLYKLAVLAPEFHKKKIILITRVCIFHALRENQFPITLEEILEETNFQTSLALKYYRILLQVCNLPKLSLKPNDFIPLIANELVLSPEIVQKAIEIILEYQKIFFTSVTARSVAAGALFFACRVMHHPCNRNKICSLLNLSQCTLRSRLKQMERIMIY